jgi:hypothetical protein
MAFSPVRDLAIIGAVGAQETSNCFLLCVAQTVFAAGSSDNGNIPAKAASPAKRVASLSKSAKLQIVGAYGVSENVEQVYAIHPDRDGAGHRDGDADLQFSA